MAEGNFYPRVKRCYCCGSEVKTNSVRTVLCDDCKKIRKQERNERLRSKYIGKMYPGSFVIVYDPDVDFGFRRGAIIDREELRCMLSPTNHCLTIGTRLKNVQGELFEVVKKKNGGLELLSLTVIIN